MNYTYMLPIREANKLGLHLNKFSLLTVGNQHRLIKIKGRDLVKITDEEAEKYKMMTDHLRKLK